MKATPCSRKTVNAILALQEALKEEFGVDYSFSVHGAGHLLGQSNIVGVVEPRTGKLPEMNAKNWKTFFQDCNLKVGERFDYSFSNFLFRDVERVAKSEGFEIKYISGETCEITKTPLA